MKNNKVRLPINHHMLNNKFRAIEKFTTEDLYNLYKLYENLKADKIKISQKITQCSEAEKTKLLAKTTELEVKLYEIKKKIERSKYSRELDIDFTSAFDKYLNIKAKVEQKNEYLTDRWYVIKTYLYIESPKTNYLPISPILLYENSYDHLSLYKEYAYNINIFEILISLDVNTPFYAVIKEACLQAIENRIQQEKGNLVARSIKNLRNKKESINQSLDFLPKELETITKEESEKKTRENNITIN